VLTCPTIISAHQFVVLQLAGSTVISARLIELIAFSTFPTNPPIQSYPGPSKESNASRCDCAFGCRDWSTTFLYLQRTSRFSRKHLLLWRYPGL
jgi:hypothetical protein